MPAVPVPVVRAVSRLIPGDRIPWARTRLLRAAGFDVDPTAVFMDIPTVLGSQGDNARLRIGRNCFVNVECLFDLGAAVTVSDHVYLAHRVMLITSSHDMGGPWQRADTIITNPIEIGQGAWIGAGSVVLPGVTIGAGAVVGAGSVVTRDVEPHTLAAGAPARQVRSLPRP